MDYKETDPMMIEIKNLHVDVDGQPILRGLNLRVGAGKIVAIMGPNGSGKSTLSNVLAGKQDYSVTKGEVIFMGKNLLEMDSPQRSHAGVFLAFQYPVEIPGVATMNFLKASLNAQRKARGENPLTTPDFMRKVKETALTLNIPMDMLKRALNVGFSGGEKKRMEILQMALLQPNLCILDETDSGLDIDALKIVSDGINRLRSPERTVIIITHYQRLLDYVIPDSVHVLSRGRIIKSGGKELAQQLEVDGYGDIIPPAA